MVYKIITITSWNTRKITFEKVYVMFSAGQYRPPDKVLQVSDNIIVSNLNLTDIFWLIFYPFLNISKQSKKIRMFQTTKKTIFYVCLPFKNICILYVKNIK